MGFLGLCQGDPLIDTLREVFGQHIIRKPEERYKPLTTLAVRGDKISFRGALAPLVVADPPLVFDPSLFAQSRMTNISGRKTRSVDIDLGLKILDGFLGGFGVPSAGITAKFAGASKVTYTFEDVFRSWVDINSVGRVLRGKEIDKENPAATIYFGSDAYDFIVLDSVITSSDFTISVDRSSVAQFKLDVPAIQKIVGDLNIRVGVSSSTGLDLTFKGATQLAFAFSCVRFALSDDGEIGSLLPDDRVNVLYAAALSQGQRMQHTPDRVLLSPAPAMLEIE